MIKKTFYFFMLTALLFTVSCLPGKQDSLTREFAAQFDSILSEFSDKIDLAKSDADRSSLLQSKSSRLKALLDAYDKKISSDDAVLLKCKLLLEMSLFNEANKKIDFLLGKKSPLSPEAEMLKVHILIRSGDTDNALLLLKKIEPSIKNKNDLHFAWLYFALFSNDSNVMKLYANKLLAVRDLPRNLSKFFPDIFHNLSTVARENKNFDESKNFLNKALSSSPNAELKRVLDSESALMDFIGAPAVPIFCDSWFNSPPLSLKKLKGYVVVFYFWAPSSDQCRSITPVLTELFNSYKNNGLVIIGLSKLYGKFLVDHVEKKSLAKADEIALIQKYIENNKMTFPVSISNEGFCFDDYKIAATPSLIFIDKFGAVSDFHSGSGLPLSIKYKIQKLLEVSFGKN